jgi:tetratricopeptide (TPR) repeat protein
MARRIHLVLTTAAICIVSAADSYSQADAWDQATALFQQHHWSEAATAFAAVENAQPGKTDAFLFQGKCLINLSRFHDAAGALRTYIAAHPRSDDAAYLLAYVSFRENKPRESLEQYTQAARLKTPTADDLKIVALDYVLLRDYADAAHYLEVALKMDPHNIEARYHLGRVRYQQNRFDDAIAAFQEVLQSDPDNAKAQDNLGLSLEAKNRVAEAIVAYQKAIAIDKAATVHGEQPYLNLGILLIKSNQASDAVPLLTTATQINPKSAKAHYELARALFSTNQLEQSQREVQESIRLDPSDSPPHYLLGRIYHSLGKPALAAGEFKRTDELMRSRSASGPGMAAGSDHAGMDQRQ